MRHEFHPEALAEYEATALYYTERDPAAGQRFIEAVEDTLDRILASPTRWRVIDEDVRRCLTRMFPYGVLYTIEQMDHLVLGSFMLEKPRQPPLREDVDWWSLYQLD